MISLFDLLLLSVALAMDCFTVSIMSGVILRRRLCAAILRMALLFGIFQALMPLLGWAGTAHFSQYLEAVDHWIAFGMLAFIGGKMIWESFGDDDHQTFNPLSLHTQLLLAVATSIDALAVGISLSMDMEPVRSALLKAVAVLIVTIISVVAGILGGRKIGTRFGRGAETVGGIVLILIGLNILLGIV